MKVVIQRVIQASVTIQQQLHASIGRGMMILVGIQADDHEEDIEWLSSKICNLRIFDDENGIMNRSILETAGEILAVSQFTLMARTKKGNRPSYIDAAKPEISVPVYSKFGQKTEGPVTIILDSKNRLYTECFMELKELQEKVDEWIKSYGVRYFNELTNMTILTEEVGELARVMARKYGEQSFKEGEKDNLADEMADILWVLTCLANQTGVDLTEAMEINFAKKTARDLKRHKNNPKIQ